MRISEISEQCDISPDTLRYYERVGLIPTVKRSKSGIRNYDQTDVEWVGFIKCMRNAGLPIEVLAEYVELVRQGNATVEARKEILITQRAQVLAQIEALQQTLELLDYKLEVYENILLKKEKALVDVEEETTVPQNK